MTSYAFYDPVGIIVNSVAVTLEHSCASIPF